MEINNNNSKEERNEIETLEDLAAMIERTTNKEIRYVKEHVVTIEKDIKNINKKLDERETPEQSKDVLRRLGVLEKAIGILPDK